MSFKDELISKTAKAKSDKALSVRTWMDENVGADAFIDSIKNKLSEAAEIGKTNETVELLEWTNQVGDVDSFVCNERKPIVIPFHACTPVDVGAMNAYMEGLVKDINKQLGLNGTLVCECKRNMNHEYGYYASWA